jgi:hypothetical protein
MLHQNKNKVFVGLVVEITYVIPAKSNLLLKL